MIFAIFACMKINFKEFRMFVDITQENTRVVDVRREFADIIYKSVNGVVAHDLALRIYRSEGEIEVNPEEFGIMSQIAESGTPIFNDSFKANVIE